MVLYRLLTSNHVIGETYTLLRVRLGYRPAHEFLRRVRASKHTERVFVSEAWEAEAEAMLAQFEDQDFSYLDATSFVVMRNLRLTSAFAFDHHFSVAGFTCNADGPMMWAWSGRSRSSARPAEHGLWHEDRD